jgi:MscS family membrane protein
VREVGIRSTRIETLDGTFVTVPNSKFADSPVENVSLEPSRKVKVKLGLVYDTTPEEMDKAMELLKGITAGNQNLEEKVIVSFTEFGDFSLNLLLIYYITKGADILETQSAINRAILAEFNDHGLDFAFPTQTLYTKNV